MITEERLQEIVIWCNKINTIDNDPDRCFIKICPCGNLYKFYAEVIYDNIILANSVSDNLEELIRNLHKDWQETHLAYGGD